MEVSKKGFDVVFNTTGVISAGQARAAALMQMGIAAAKMKYEKDFQMQKMAMEQVGKNRNVDGRGQEDYDALVQSKLSELTKKAETGSLSMSDVMQSGMELDATANIINTSFKLGDELIKDAANRGYIPERLQEFNTILLQSMPLKGREKAEAYMKINQSGAYNAKPFSSFLIDEGATTAEFIKGYGVNTEELRKGIYMATTETKMELFQRKPGEGFQVKRAGDGLVDEEIYAEASKNSNLSRIMSDAVMYEAFKRTVEKTKVNVDWEDVQKLGLTEYLNSNAASSVFTKAIEEEFNKIVPEEAYRIERARLTQVLDNAAAGKYDVTTVPESSLPKTYFYENGVIMYGNSLNKEVISTKSELVSGRQFYSIPKDGRKPVVVTYKGETYNMVPHSFNADGKRLYLRGNVLVKGNEEEMGVFQEIKKYAQQSGRSEAEILDQAKTTGIPGIDKKTVANIKMITLPAGEYVSGDESAGITISEGLRLDPASARSGGNIITILSSMTNKAGGSKKNDDLFVGND